MGLSSKHVSAGDGHSWSQDVFKDERLVGVATKSTQAQQQQRQQRQTALQQQANPPLRCPRCDSSNTKFCYYNNYSRSQPRHFCKACRRHWTNGGTLRNVPVGGGRKNKRQKTAHAAATTITDHQDGARQQQQLQQLPVPFATAADVLCQQQGVLLQPAASTSSPSDYLSGSGSGSSISIGLGGGGGNSTSNSSSSSSILASLFSQLPPIPPLASGLLTDYDVVAAGCDPPFPFFPFTRQLEDPAQEETKMVGASGVSLYHSLFPGFGLANTNINMVEPSPTTAAFGGGGGYWWDGFVPQPQPQSQLQPQDGSTSNQP